MIDCSAARWAEGIRVDRVVKGTRMVDAGGVLGRSGELWTTEDYDTLIEGLRDGLPLDELAEQLQRRQSAVAGRCSQMLPPDFRVPRAEADLHLRPMLGDPEFDWKKNLLHNTGNRRGGAAPWDPELDDRLQSCWDERTLMSTLVEETGASEVMIASRLVRLGIAASSSEVVDRLGCRPDGTLAGRVRLAADRAAAAVWVLIADGFRGTPRARPMETETVRHRHVSIHLDVADAEETLDGLLHAHLDKGGTLESLESTIAQRTLGEDTIGITHHSADLT